MPRVYHDQGIPEAPEPARRVATALLRAGGRAWLVGGWVRDALLGRQSKDLDMEAHGLPAEAVLAALRQLGQVSAVGRSFSVFKLRLGRLDLDVSLPRASDDEDAPNIGLVEAARRRDLTINAIAMDPLSGEIADPWGGADDIAAHLLRAVDRSRFLDDPLRALRVVQLAARLGFSVHEELATLCASADLATIPGERTAIELEKLLLGAERPSDGLKLARSWGLLHQVAPELDGCDPAVLDLALDRAAAMTAPDRNRKLALMLAVLLHAVDLDAATSLLDRLHFISRDRWPLRDRVLVAIARWPELTVPTSDAALRGLAETSALGLCAATALAVTSSSSAADALARGEALGIDEAPLVPLLMGRDLIALGVSAGPQMGQLLSLVRAGQIQGTVNTPDEAASLVRRLLARSHAEPLVD